MKGLGMGYAAEEFSRWPNLIEPKATFFGIVAAPGHAFPTRAG